MYMATGATFRMCYELGNPSKRGESRQRTSIGALSGLLEHANDASHRPVDLYRLHDDLHLDLDELMRAVEAAELLGFATVAADDLTLTPSVRRSPRPLF